MSRVVEGEYSRIPLHLMIEAGRAAGVPFKSWDANEPTLNVTSLEVTRPMVNLEALDKLWGMEAIQPGSVKNLGKQLSSEVYRALRYNYIHHSASNKGIANPPNTSRYESTVSRERRNIMGNMEG